MPRKRKLPGSHEGIPIGDFVEEFEPWPTPATFDGDGVQVTASIGRDGREHGDPVPMAPPVGMGPSDFDPIALMIQQLVKNEVAAKMYDPEAPEEEWETEEEANDFDVEDDMPTEVGTPYEAVFDPPPPRTNSEIDATTTRITPRREKPLPADASTPGASPDRGSSAGTAPASGASDSSGSNTPVGTAPTGQPVSST